MNNVLVRYSCISYSSTLSYDAFLRKPHFVCSIAIIIFRLSHLKTPFADCLKNFCRFLLSRQHQIKFSQARGYFCICDAFSKEKTTQAMTTMMMEDANSVISIYLKLNQYAVYSVQCTYIVFRGVSLLLHEL